MKMTLRVVFADDNYLVRAGVSALLSEADEIELIRTVGDADALIQAVAEQRPDAVLTDIRMPPTHTIEGINAAKRIRADYPDIGVVVLSQFADDDYAFELLENGVGGLGYLLKERVADKDELVRALQEVARGGSALDPKVIEVLLARKSHEEPSALLGLSDREREVLQQMATGRNNHTIAKTLYMSDRAVEKHIGSIFQKLGLVEEVDVNRRIMAVLAFLEATGPTR
jgi:DNA-binding NarL/FixJ family response regulator